MDTMRSDSSELLLEQQQQELRARKLKELAPKKRVVPPKKRSWRENLNFYTTSVLVFFSISGGSSLLFLVPLYVDPALSTLASDFIDKPTLCTTVRREDITGLMNCSWSSCREGCTSDMYRCTHIYVTFANNYTVTNDTLFDYNNFTNYEQSEEAMLLVNIKGCGYPPSVTCKNFTERYGGEGTLFPCHYARQNRSLVLTTYKREDQVGVIINFFVIPFSVTVISSVGLCLMHCECHCRKDPPRRKAAYRRPRIENLR